MVREMQYTFMFIGQRARNAPAVTTITGVVAHEIDDSRTFAQC